MPSPSLCIFGFSPAEKQPKKPNWFASGARKLSARFFHSAKSKMRPGESSEVDDKGRVQATTDAEPHYIDIQLARSHV